MARYRIADTDRLWSALLGAVAVVVIVVGLTSTSSFLTEYNAMLGSTAFGYVALMALPMTCIILVGEIDISVGAVMGISAAVLARTIDAGAPGWVAALAALAVAAACGALNGVLIAFLRVPSIVATIGTLALFSGIQLGLLGSATFVKVPAWIYQIGQGAISSSGIPIVLVILLAAAALLWVILKKLRVGGDIYSIGCNRMAAQVAGIRVRSTVFWLFLASGVVAGIAGLVYVGPIGSINADVGTNVELTVIATVLLGGIDVFGGRGRLDGVIASIIVMGLLTDVMVLNQLTTTVQSLITGALLICGVIFPTYLRRRADRGIKPRAGQPANPGAGQLPEESDGATAARMAQS